MSRRPRRYDNERELFSDEANQKKWLAMRRKIADIALVWTRDNDNVSAIIDPSYDLLVQPLSPIPYAVDAETGVDEPPTISSLFRAVTATMFLTHSGEEVEPKMVANSGLKNDHVVTYQFNPDEHQIAAVQVRPAKVATPKDAAVRLITKGDQIELVVY